MKTASGGFSSETQGRAHFRATMDVFHGHFLLADASVDPQALRHRLERSKRLNCSVDVAVDFWCCLCFDEHLTLQDSIPWLCSATNCEQSITSELSRGARAATRFSTCGLSGMMLWMAAERK